MWLAVLQEHISTGIDTNSDDVFTALDGLGPAAQITEGVRKVPWISEAVNLRIEDIDSKRMVLWVRNSKGNKDRSVPLPAQTLAQLRAYWLGRRSKTWLFLGKSGTRDTESWLQAREKELLALPYYHVNLTLPHGLGILYAPSKKKPAVCSSAPVLIRSSNWPPIPDASVVG
jgi:hypothetical protein